MPQPIGASVRPPRDRSSDPPDPESVSARVVDLQFHRHADPRTTLTYLHTRDRLSQSPAYVLSYK
jgi:hypothetical protein